MSGLDKKVIVITGASSGFGQGAALRFAEEGADLVLAARRKRLLDSIAKECAKYGGTVLTLEADVSKREQVEEIAKNAMKEFGRIDIWINNAGVASYGEFDRVPIEEHEQVIQTNLFGTLYGSHAAMQHFRKKRRGVLINMSSYLGKGSAPYHGSYVASKHAIRGLGMALRQDVQVAGLNNIHVCTVMPTSHDTPFFAHAGNHTGKPVRPTKPVYEPENVVETLIELASNPQPEVMVGTSAKVASVAGKLMPIFLEHRMAKKVKKEHMSQRESASESSGAVFKPVRSGTDIHGGWLHQSEHHDAHAHNGRKWKVAAAIVPLALAAVKVAGRWS